MRTTRIFQTLYLLAHYRTQHMKQDLQQRPTNTQGNLYIEFICIIQKFYLLAQNIRKETYNRKLHVWKAIYTYESYKLFKKFNYPEI